MFTGITRGVFSVARVEHKPDLLRYAIEFTPELLAGLGCGASVSVDGACQTVVAIDAHEVVFEAVRETLDKTTLGGLTLGQRVSIERSVKVGDEIGGHEVAGHVTGTGELVGVERKGDVNDLRIAVPAAWMKYISQKGFIAVDGSSLTVGEVDRAAHAFTLHLIPETIRLTNFGSKRTGDCVNIELDARTVAIVDTVERVLAERLANERNS